MATIDLDAARAARIEALKDTEAPNVVLGGETFELPRELPFGVFLRFGEMKENPEDSLSNMRWMVDVLFGEKAERFLELSPSFDDFMELVSALIDSYEVAPPEASASPSSS